MLALTRKKGESLVVNNNIEITVLEIRGDQIKIGISAPKNVPVYRLLCHVLLFDALIIPSMKISHNGTTPSENEASLKADGLEALKNLL